MARSQSSPTVAAIVAACPPRGVRGYLRGRDGAAAIELAIGAVVLAGVAALCFDLYARIKADTSIGRMAVTMADYVSRGTAPDGDDMTALGKFLHAHELGVPANLVYVVTAVHQPAGDPAPAPVILWSDDTIRIGDATVTADLADDCTHQVAQGGGESLPAGFKPMSPDEVVIIVEVCARLTREGSIIGRFVAGDIYCLHALPAREAGQKPAAPVYAKRRTEMAAVFAFGYGALAGATLLAPASPFTPGASRA